MGSFVIILIFVVMIMSLFFFINPEIRGPFVKVYFTLIMILLLVFLLKIFILLMPIIIIIVIVYILDYMIKRKKNDWDFNGMGMGSQSYREYYYKKYYQDFNYNNKYDKHDKNNNTKTGFKYTDNDDDYEILGIKRTASSEDVKKAYKQKVREYHPDFHQSKSELEKKEYEDKFKKINEAYNRLKNKYNL